MTVIQNDITFYWIGLIVITIYGLCIGSFLNVVILRLPIYESLSKRESHCFKCGKSIKWYDNIPVFSYIVLGGKCRNCGNKISIQYPLIEITNTFIWVLIYLRYKISIDTVIYVSLASALLALSVIDERTFEIPIQINYFIGVLGLIATAIGYKQWYNHIIGMLVVSVFLLVIWFVTDGLGFGDVKLMFFAGLVVGWKIIIVGFLTGCLVAIPVHVLRMKISNKAHKLAFGPYLSFGIYTALFIGEQVADIYISWLQ